MNANLVVKAPTVNTVAGKWRVYRLLKA